MTLLSDYFNYNVLDDKNYKFGPDEKFKLPIHDTHQEHIDFIGMLPSIIHPNVFGFHSNADITKDIN